MCYSSGSWHKYGLRKQLLIVFSLFTVTSLIAIGISCIIFIVVTGNQVHDNLYSGFLNNSQNVISDIMTNGAQLYDMKLAQLTRNFPNIMAFDAEDSFRTDYPFGYIPSYYNWPGQLVNPIFSTSYDANITYAHSTINVYDETIYDVPNLSPSIKNTINKTAQMDYLFVPTFSLNPDFFAGYVSTPDQFLRYYPGAVNDDLLSTYIMYSNLDDYWYVTTMANPDEVTYTSPYYDPIAHQLMITIGRVLHNPYDKSILGALGADLILKSIQTDIKQLTYLGKSRTILFEKNSGYVIADSANDINSLVTYQTMTNPISADMWNSLLQNNNTLLNENTSYFLSVNLQTSNGQYILVSIIDQQYVLDTFSTIMDSISGIIRQEVGVVIGIFFVVLIVTLGCAILLTNRIVTPLQRLSEASSNMASRIGEANLTKGVNLEIKPTGIFEIDNMTNKFTQTVENIGKPTAVVTHQNSYYGNVPWNFTESLPSAPPAYEEI
jgi:hypothetical protein